MKPLIRLMALVSVVLSAHPAHAVVGYYYYVFSAGSTLFCSQLDNSPNTLSTLFASTSLSTIPNGTTISLWDSATLGFSTGSTFLSGHWSVDLTLQAGNGYRLDTSAPFTASFFGRLLNHAGSVWDGGSLPGSK